MNLKSRQQMFKLSLSVRHAAAHGHTQVIASVRLLK